MATWKRTQCSFISYSSQAPYHRIIRLFNSRPLDWRLLGVVDVVDQVLHNSRRVGGLHALAVVRDDSAGRGANNDGALLALYSNTSASFVLRGMDMLCSGVVVVRATFLPYRLRSSALMDTNFSPPMEKPLAKALSLEVKAAARELMSSCES